MCVRGAGVRGAHGHICRAAERRGGRTSLRPPARGCCAFHDSARRQPDTLVNAIARKNLSLATDAFGRGYDELATHDSRLCASRLHLHPLVRLTKQPRYQRWARREVLVEALKKGGFNAADIKYFCHVTCGDEKAFAPRFNDPIPPLDNPDPSRVQRQLDKCRAAVHEQFNQLASNLDDDASVGARQRANEVLDRFSAVLSEAFLPRAIAKVATAAATELRGTINILLPGHDGAGQAAEAAPVGVHLAASARAFGASERDADGGGVRGDDGSDDGGDDGSNDDGGGGGDDIYEPGCDCDGVCTYAVCTGATPGQPTTWTASAFEEQPLLRRAICLAVQEHVQVLVRRISQTHHIELHDVYIRNVRRVTPRKRQPRLRVEFTICMVPDSILRQFAHDGNVFNALAILETARAHHAHAHTTRTRTPSTSGS